MPGEPRGSGLGLDDRGSGGGAVALLRDVGVEGTGLVGVHEPLAVGSVGLGGVGADQLVVAGADLEELDGAVQLAVLLGRVDVAEESALLGLDGDVALSGAGEGRNWQGAGNGQDGGDLGAAGLGGVVAHRVSFELIGGAGCAFAMNRSCPRRAGFPRRPRAGPRPSPVLLSSPLQVSAYGSGRRPIESSTLPRRRVSEPSSWRM